MIAIGKITFTFYGDFYDKDSTTFVEFTKKRKPYEVKEHDYIKTYTPVPYKLLNKELADRIRYFESTNTQPPFEDVKAVEEIAKDNNLILVDIEFPNIKFNI